MKKVYNFAAGPSTLPTEVLKEMQDEMLNYKDSGMSVMEISHRSPLYEGIYESANSLISKLLNIPNDYDVLFLQGGASHQFMMAPMNLVKNKKIDFIESGMFSKKALAEQKKFADVTVIGSSADKTYSYIPNVDTLEYSKDADYIHITSNNTIVGTEFKKYPEVDTPIVADMSSNIMSRPIDISKFALIYAGAQKNLGIAGVTVVILNKKYLNDEDLPTILKYQTHIAGKSSFNTPPTFSIYVLEKVLQYVDSQGGVLEMEKRNIIKSDLLYNYIDNSGFFLNKVAKNDRSINNVVFNLPTPELEAKFVKESNAADLKFLKGHRALGGMRASIYNAMPLKGVETLLDFMKNFQKENQ